MAPVYYNDYLRVPGLKECVRPLTTAHDEHLFIITHQTYELWFKQILFELDSVIPKLNNKFSDNSPTLFEVNHRLNRVVEIWKVLVLQFTILETMTPLDFLDFRSQLFPASGFQSLQFKEIEATLGLKSHTRFHPEQKDEKTGETKPQTDYYKHLGTEKGGFTDNDKSRIEERESSVTLLDAVKSWLNRIPFFSNDSLWIDYKGGQGSVDERINHPFWKDYVVAYRSCLTEFDKAKGKDEELIKAITEGNESFTAAEIKATLFIMSYRDYPIFHLPFQLLTNVTEVDELLSDWRHRHVYVVMRMIGTRSGTKAGASGAAYLKGIAEKNYVFKDLSALVTYLIPRKDLPALPEKLLEKIGYMD
jgi:tryptophan 2,3-dioxygenase